MVGVWIMLWFAFALGPVDYYRLPAVETWLIAWAGVSLFCVGVFAGRWMPFRRYDSSTRLELHNLDRTITVASWIGISGVLLMVIDKLFLSGLDYSHGLAAIRFQRAADIVAEIEVARTPLLYLGYLIFSFSYAAIGLFLLEAEQIRGQVARWAQLSVISPVGYALLYGGRAPILLLCFLVVGVGLVRAMWNRPFLAAHHRMRWKFLILCIGFLVYDNYTWEARREYSMIEDYPAYLSVADQGWSLAPKPWLHEAVNAEKVSSDSAMNFISTMMYITHGVVSLDKIREQWREFHPYVGIYQIGVLYGLVRVFFPNPNLADQMTTDLRNADIYGWFVTAWGAWYLDFGLPVSILCIFFWGLLCGVGYFHVRATCSPRSGLLLSFGLGSIFASPLNAPLGIANSALIFAACVATVYLLRPGAGMESWNSRKKPDR